MSTAARFILGIVIGAILSVLTLGLALISVKLVVGAAMISSVVAVTALLSGATLGAVSVGLGYLTAGKERSVLVLLIGVALAALTVMLGRYGNGSIMPLGIYSLAVVNSLMIARATAVLVRPAHLRGEPNLRG